MQPRDLLNKMAHAEEAFLRTRFVAPVVPGCPVCVRLEGIVWQFRVTPRDFEGWAVLQPENHGSARVVGEAKLSQVKEYLGLFPQASLVLCERRASVWWALLGDSGDRRFRADGPVPLRLA